MSNISAQQDAYFGTVDPADEAMGLNLSTFNGLKVTYGPATEVAGTYGVKRCQVFAGTHHVGDVEFTGLRYYVLPLYSGNKLVSTYSRDEMIELVAELARRAPKNPKDCGWDCQGLKH